MKHSLNFACPLGPFTSNSLFQSKTALFVWENGCFDISCELHTVNCICLYLDWASLEHSVRYGPHLVKKCLRASAKCALRSSCAFEKYHPGLCSPLKHSIVANNSNFDSKDINQNVRMRRLNLAFDVCICPKTCFRISRPILLEYSAEDKLMLFSKFSSKWAVETIYMKCLKIPSTELVSRIRLSKA